MATKTWRGYAAAVAQVDTITVTNSGWANTDTVTATMNDKDMVTTISSLSGNLQNSVVNQIVTAWNASTIPEYTEITAARGSNTTVTLTADTAGIPFTTTVSESTAGNGTVSIAATTAVAGPAVANTADNWSGGTNPVAADTVVFENSSRDCKYNLEAFTTLNFAKVQVAQSYTGDLGLPRDNGGDYVEYRPTYFKCTADAVEIGTGEGAGSGRIRLDLHTGNTTVDVFDSGSPAETGIPAVLLKMVNTDNTLNVLKGSVGVAYFQGDVSTVPTIRVAHRDNPAGDADVVCGDGVTLTTIEQSGGELTIESNATTVTQEGGEMTILGTATTTTLSIAGRLVDRSSGAFATVQILPGGEYDRSHDLRTKTVGNTEMSKTAILRDPFSSITHTNGIDLYRCSPQEVTIEKKRHKTWTETSI
jgi:hypothetical protein